MNKYIISTKNRTQMSGEKMYLISYINGHTWSVDISKALGITYNSALIILGEMRYYGRTTVERYGHNIEIERVFMDKINRWVSIAI